MAGIFGVTTQEREKGRCLPIFLVRIMLNQIMRLADGTIVISPTLASDSEIDFEIDQLHKELEIVKEEAKRELKKQKANYDKQNNT